MKTFIIDPGHGMGNRSPGKYDPGAVAAGVEEAEIVMDWANELRTHLMEAGHRVIRTRAHAKDPAPVGQRAAIALQYGGDIMLSLHCNAATGTAQGTETFYRGEENAAVARQINKAVVAAMGSRDRGIKTEGQSQHTRLAVMSFQPCFLLELGFIDHPGERAKMLDPVIRRAACKGLADVLIEAIQ